MEYERSEIKVGLLLVVGVVLLVVFFAVINRWSVADHWEASAVFANVMGLKQDASVQYAGRHAGWVKGLRYVRVPDAETGKHVTHVELVLAVIADVPLTDQDVAYIDRSLTGEVVVEIEPGPGVPFTPGENVTLKSKEVPTFASLKEEIEQVMADVDRFAKEQRPVVEEALENFRDTFAQVKAQLAEEDGELHQAIVKFRQLGETSIALLEENREKLGQAVTSAGEVFAQIRSLTEELEPALKSSADGVQDVVARLQSLLAEQGPELKQAVTNFRQLGEDLNRLVATNRSRLSSMMEDGEQAAATVRDTVEDLRRSPWRLLKPPDVDDYTQSLYDTARELVLSSRELASTAEELKRLTASAPTDAERARLEQLLESAAKRLARAAELQEELWEALKARR